MYLSITQIELKYIEKKLSEGQDTVVTDNAKE